MCLKRPSTSRTHWSSMRLSHGKSITAADTPLAANSSAARQALVSSMGPYPTNATSVPGLSTTPRPTCSA